MIDEVGSQFVWFLGVIDDIKDPKELGRVRVRVINEHDNVVESEDLSWAIVLGSTTSASYLGLGSAPVGMQTGTRVIGFYLDGDKKTKPVIMGTMPFIKDGVDADHSVSSVARGKGPVQKEYLEYEPQTEYKAEYPFNNTITTKSGHVIEMDDTPKAERLHVYHKSGSYIEMFPDGKIVIKSTKENINIAIDDQQIISDNGNVFITAKEEARIFSTSDASLRSDADVGIIAGGDTLISGNQIEINGSNVKIKGGSIAIEGSINLTGDVNVLGSLKVNGRPVDLK